jgi:hypothetical protein
LPCEQHNDIAYIAFVVFGAQRKTGDTTRALLRGKMHGYNWVQVCRKKSVILKKTACKTNYPLLCLKH